jgi:hypothetical protein
MVGPACSHLGPVAASGIGVVTGPKLGEYEELIVPNSILEAIRLGQWDYEPEQVSQSKYDATRALPGSDAKVGIMAARIEQGLPLWHPEDALTFDDLQDGDE